MEEDKMRRKNCKRLLAAMLCAVMILTNGTVTGVSVQASEIGQMGNESTVAELPDESMESGEEAQAEEKEDQTDSEESTEEAGNSTEGSAGETEDTGKGSEGDKTENNSEKSEDTKEEDGNREETGNENDDNTEEESGQGEPENSTGNGGIGAGEDIEESEKEKPDEKNAADMSTELIGNAEERLSLMTADDDIASGFVDEDYGHIAWVIDANGKLTVEGTGDFADPSTGSYLDYSRAPWNTYPEYLSIKSAEVNVSGMTDASYMFYRGMEITNIDLSNFDTSQIINMSGMFSCPKLTSLDVSGFDTSKVTSMAGMFSGCNSLTSLDLGGFNTSNVTSIGGMFRNCNSLKSLDLSGFDTSKVTNMGNMYEGCNSLTSLNISNFNTRNVTDMECMFYDCHNLTNLDVRNFDTSNVTSMDGMFSNCRSLTSLDVSNFDTRNVTFMGSWFVYTDLDPGDGVEVSGMFSGCSSLTELNVSNFDTSNVISMWGMFYKCSNLERLDLSTFNTSHVRYMAWMFYGCNKLSNLDVSNFDTSNVINISDMFGGCSSLSELDLSSFALSNATDTSPSEDGDFYDSDMLTDCSALSTIYAPCNLKYSVSLPVNYGDKWFKSDGSTVTELPQNLSNSVVLGRNYIPKEKEDSAIRLSNSEDSIFLFRDAWSKKAITEGRVCIEEEFSGKHYYSPLKDTGYVRVPLSKNCKRVFVSTYFDKYESVGGWTDLNYYRSESGIYVFDLNPRKENYTCPLPKFKTSVQTSAPDIETPDESVGLFNMGMETEFDFGKGVSSTITYDEEDKTIKVAIATEGKSKIKYDEIKDEYYAEADKNKSLDEQFEEAEEKMQPGNLCNVKVKVKVKGYLEFTDAGEFIEGGAIIYVGGSGTTEYRPACTGGVGYAKCELSLTVDNKLKFNYVEGNLTMSDVLKVEPAGKIVLGAGWSLAHAEIGATGKFPVSITFPFVDEKESLSIDANFELYGEVKFFCIGGKRTAKVEGNIWPAISFYNDGSLDIDSDDLSILPRDYLAENKEERIRAYSTQNGANFTSSDSFRYSDISEDKGVFEENNVQYVQLSNGMEILAWVHDFGDKSSANRTTLVYSINKNDGNGWSSITPVCSNTSTGDYYPDMEADGNKAYLVWSKASKEFSEDVGVDELCNHMDVYVSVFENGAFSEPQMVSDANNGLVEFSPKAAASGNSAAVAWMTNTENDYHYTKGKNAIYVCEYKNGVWGKPVCHAQNLNYVSDYAMDYVDGSVAVLYAEDADNNAQTKDGCVYYVKNGVKNKVGDASYNAEIVDFSDGMIYFSGGNRVYKVSAGNLSYIYDLGIETSNFSVLKNDSGAEVIMFLNQNGFESNIYASYCRNGEYTSPVPVVADGSRVTNYSPVYHEDGTIGIAYNEQEILKDSDYIFGLTDMVIKRNVKPNLFFVDTELAYNAFDVAPENQIEFVAGVSNYTNNVVSQVKVSLSGSSAGEVGTVVLDVDIPVGEKRYVRMPYTLPSNITNQHYTLTVTPVDFEDTDLSDNSAVCELGFSDIALSGLSIKDNTITGKVINIGYKTAENVSLTIREDNQENAPLAVLSCGKGNLAVGESWEFSQEVSPAEFKNIGDTKYYLISAQTESIENNYSNGSGSVYCTPIAPESISLDQSVLLLKEKSTAMLYATVLPENSTFKDAVFVSSDTSVVIADRNGKIYAVGKGSAIVTAYTLDGSRSAECKITVEELGEEKYVLSERDLEMEIESEASLCIKDENGNLIEGVVWSSTDENIVTVSQDGAVMAKGEGIAYLVAEIDTFTDVCIVRVSDHSILQLACEESSLDLTVGETAQLNIVIVPEDTTMDKTLTYVSDDEAVATVNRKGLITAVSSGNTVVTVSSVNGIQKRIEVVVNEPTTYTVAFDSRGGIKVDSVEVIANKIVTGEDEEYIGYLPSVPESYKEGYSFEGWYADNNGTGEALSTNTPITGNVTYYAKWKRLDMFDDDSDTVLPGDIPEGGIPENLWIAGIDADGYQYTGTAIKPTVRVYDGSKRLNEGQDYTLSYKRNTKANDASNVSTAPTITVTGKGNYSGKETITFKIFPIELTEFNMTVADMTRAYNQQIQKPVPSITVNGKKLKRQTDFFVSYPDYKPGAYQDIGTYRISITGTGNYTGEQTLTFDITDKLLISKASVSKIRNQAYTGKAVTPAPVVKYQKIGLVEHKDYELEYQNNVDIGKATIVIKGIGDYAGKKTISFQITGGSLKKVKVTGLVSPVVYTGEELLQNCSLSMLVNGVDIPLLEGKDYTVTYKNNVKAGTAKVIFTGINGYTGTLKKSYKISPYDILSNNGSYIEYTKDIVCTYLKGGSRPEPDLYFKGTLLKKGVDYTLSYRNNNAVRGEQMPTIVVKGKGSFKNKIEIPFTIKPQNLSNMTLASCDKVYEDKADIYKIIPKLLDINGKALSAGKDFDKNSITYAYENKVVLEDGTSRKAGDRIKDTDIIPANTRIRVTLTCGSGDLYEGTFTGTYRIVAADIKSAKVSIPAQIYTGSEITPDKTQIRVTLSPMDLSPEDYDIVSYANNIKKGKASVTIIGKGNYGGTKTVKFTIKAKGFLWWWR